MARKNSLIYDLQTHPVLKGIKNNNTVRQYKRQLIPFAQWCKTQKGIKHLDQIDDPVDLIQEYSDQMVAENICASTIHARLAAPCRIFAINMGYISKPKRLTALNSRSRRFNRSRVVNMPGRREIENRGKYGRLVAFSERVGIRRAEYAALKGSDFVQDESHHWCVRVRKGKGGKEQLQRILPEDVDFCRKYFNGSENPVFSRDEMQNHIDLHGLRAQQAQKAYLYYVSKIKENPSYRNVLKADLIRRFDTNIKDPEKRMRFVKSIKQKNRICRGLNGDLALEIYGTKTLDMTAIMAVSVFHLSHWRADVTVSNYLLCKR